MSFTPDDVDVTRPSPARVYDYVLGGTDNHPADRAAADQVLSLAPELRDLALDNRAFLSRMVRYLVSRGVRQFLDIGSGLPSGDNVHQIAQMAAPDARVLYVDNDPSVLPHARTMLAGDPRTAFIQADARNPDAIFDHPEARRLFDFDRPIAVLMVAVLHFLPERDEPQEIVRRIVKRVPAGSHLVISHLTSDGEDPRVRARIDTVYADAPSPLITRSGPEILRFFDGLELLDADLVDVGQWGVPESVERRSMRIICGVARKR